MVSSKQPRDRPPFKDITNSTQEQSTIDDPRERKRQHERERYARMPEDQKQALLKKRRKHHQQKKVAAPLNGQLQSRSNTLPNGQIKLMHGVHPGPTNPTSAKGAYSHKSRY